METGHGATPPGEYGTQGDGREHEPERDHEVQIFIDETSYTVKQKTMTGAQLKELAGRPQMYQLFLERPGEADKIINDDETVHLHDGQHFHTVPPAQFG